MLKAIKQRFPGLIIQRCQFHVAKYCTTKLTRNPESITAQELRIIVVKISKVETKEDLKVWLGEYKFWRIKMYISVGFTNPVKINAVVND